MTSAMVVARNGMRMATSTKVQSPATSATLTFPGEWKNGDRNGRGLMYIAESNSFYDTQWENGALPIWPSAHLVLQGKRMEKASTKWALVMFMRASLSRVSVTGMASTLGPMAHESKVFGGMAVRSLALC